MIFITYIFSVFYPIYFNDFYNIHIQCFLSPLFNTLLASSRFSTVASSCKIKLITQFKNVPKKPCIPFWYKCVKLKWFHLEHLIFWN